MKKISFLLLSLVALSTFTSCEAPKKKPRCLAVEAKNVKAEHPKEVQPTTPTT